MGVRIRDGLKSVHMNLRTSEVPVRFLKDREGRVSHHKRAGWYSPFHAAWINLKAMFVYGVEFFALNPGPSMLVLGLVICLPLCFGPITLGRVHLSLYWMLLGATLTILGLQSLYVTFLAEVTHDYNGSARRRWLRVFPYTRTVLLSAAGFGGGRVLGLLLVADYLRSGLSLSPADRIPYLGVFGLLLVLASFMTFTFVLVLHATLR